MDKEPGSLNEVLAPLVKEMKALWNGVYLKSSLCCLPLRFRAAIASISCDIPAARKLCGFKATTLIMVAQSALNFFQVKLETHSTSQALKGMKGQSETLILTNNTQESRCELKLKQNMIC